MPWLVLVAALSVSAALGIASNRLRAHWGLLIVPIAVFACDALILAVTIYPTSETPSVMGLVNAFSETLFPLFVLSAPPFLVGRYVPQIVRRWQDVPGREA